MIDDRERWNRKYAAGEHAGEAPSALIESIAGWLPPAGKALDVAGGAGRHALWLARRGWQVTLLDVSDTALELARRRAEAAGIELTTCCHDLQEQGLPLRAWDVILVVHYLQRSLFAEFAERLAPGGTLVVLQPTVVNLQRHSRPPREYLLEEGELPRLAAGLDVLHWQEGWLAEGRHESLLVARRSA